MVVGQNQWYHFGVIRCTTHSRLFYWGVECSLGVRFGFCPMAICSFCPGGVIENGSVARSQRRWPKTRRRPNRIAWGDSEHPPNGSGAREVLSYARCSF